MIPMEELLAKFSSVKQLQDQSWQVQCPGHDDKQASLHITTTNNKILFRCHAGCETQHILGQIGLKMSDLFQDDPDQKQLSYYVYRDKDNVPLYRIVKSSGKKFTIQHYDSVRDTWATGLGGKRRCLYRLPELLDPDLKEEIVFWVEGEKDAERLKSLRLLATTTSNGAASKLEGIDLSSLQGREVIILPDNDEPGFAYAERVKQSLIGIANRVRILELPDLETKQDISDWLDKGHDINELWELKAKSSYGDIIHIADIIDDIEKDIEARRAGFELLRGIPTGLSALDEKLSAQGVPCSKVTILAGATSSGKSALANTVILSALRHNKKVLCIALEDEPKCVAYRMLSTLSTIQNRQLQQAFVSSQEEEQFDRAKARLRTTNLYFKEDTLSVADLTEEIQAFTADNGIELVVIDFLQLVPAGAGVRFGKKQEQVDYIFGEIVQMSRKLKDTATLVVSQLHRTGDTVPTKESLYHSGALEQWAHTIGLLYRPNIPDFDDCCALIIDKQKNGPTGTIALGWHADTVSYQDADPERARQYMERLANI